jgi:CRISPR-associated protein Cmr2
VFGNDIDLPQSWEERFDAHAQTTGYYGDHRKGQVYPAQDVDEIAQASDPSGYIGLIYADGNNVGRLVATLDSPTQYAEKSQLLTSAAERAVFTALSTYLRPAPIRNERGQRKWVHPFEILTIGGDDLFVIVPGNKALKIACAIARVFEIRLKDAFDTSKAMSTAAIRGRYQGNTIFTDEPYTPAIGLSAGVIVAQENAPIFFLRDLVDELLKSAKGLAKEHARQGFYGGAVDFMVMKSITMITDKIKSFRRHALGDEGEDSERRLTARPYTWHEFAGLLNTVHALKQARVPRSQLYRLRRALDAEPGSAITPSVMEYLYTRTRMSSNHSDALLKHIEQPWCWDTLVQKRSAKLPPWMPVGDSGWETIWPDLLEAYEMVPVEE